VKTYCVPCGSCRYSVLLPPPYSGYGHHGTSSSQYWDFGLRLPSLSPLYMGSPFPRFKTSKSHPFFSSVVIFPRLSFFPAKRFLISPPGLNQHRSFLRFQCDEPASSAQFLSLESSASPPNVLSSPGGLWRGFFKKCLRPSLKL